MEGGVVCFSRRIIRCVIRLLCCVERVVSRVLIRVQGVVWCIEFHVEILVLRIKRLVEGVVFCGLLCVKCLVRRRIGGVERRMIGVKSSIEGRMFRIRCSMESFVSDIFRTVKRFVRRICIGMEGRVGDVLRRNQLGQRCRVFPMQRIVIRAGLRVEGPMRCCLAGEEVGEDIGLRGMERLVHWIRIGVERGVGAGLLRGEIRELRSMRPVQRLVLHGLGSGQGSQRRLLRRVQGVVVQVSRGIESPMRSCLVSSERGEGIALSSVEIVMTWGGFVKCSVKDIIAFMEGSMTGLYASMDAIFVDAVKDCVKVSFEPWVSRRERIVEHIERIVEPPLMERIEEGMPHRIFIWVIAMKYFMDCHKLPILFSMSSIKQRMDFSIYHRIWTVGCIV